MWSSLRSSFDGSPLYIVGKDPTGVVTLRTLIDAWPATTRLSRDDFEIAASTSGCLSKLCLAARFVLFFS